jgi:hypothetical protein
VENQVDIEPNGTQDYTANEQQIATDLLHEVGNFGFVVV